MQRASKLLEFSCPAVVDGASDTKDPTFYLAARAFGRWRHIWAIQWRSLHLIVDFVAKRRRPQRRRAMLF